MIYAPAARIYPTGAPAQHKGPRRYSHHDDQQQNPLGCLTPPEGRGAIKPRGGPGHAGAPLTGAAHGEKPGPDVGREAMNPRVGVHPGMKPTVCADNAGKAQGVVPGMGAPLPAGNDAQMPARAGMNRVGIQPPAGIVPGGLQCKMQNNIQPFHQVCGAGYPQRNYAPVANQQGFAPCGGTNLLNAQPQLLKAQPQWFNAPLHPPGQFGNNPLRAHQLAPKPGGVVCADFRAPRRPSIDWASGTPVVKQQNTTLEQLTHFNLNDGDNEDEGDRDAVVAVQLPAGILYESWISLKVSQFVDELELLLHFMFRRDMNLCTHSTCPAMKAGEFHNYSWSDGLPGHKAETVSAPIYIRSFIRYARKLLSDSYLFPINHDPASGPLAGEACDQKAARSSITSIGDFVDPAYGWAALRETWGKYWEPGWKMETPKNAKYDANGVKIDSKWHSSSPQIANKDAKSLEQGAWKAVDSSNSESDDQQSKDSEMERIAASFPPEFNYFIKQIMRRLFRVYCHVIRHHSSQLEILRLYEPMMRGFKRVLLTALIFNLIPEVELKAVDPLVGDARELLRAHKKAQKEMRVQQLKDPDKWEKTVAKQKDVRERQVRAAQKKRREQRGKADAPPRMYDQWERKEVIAKTKANAKAIADAEVTPEAIAKAEARARARADADARAEAAAKRRSRNSLLNTDWGILKLK